MKHLSIKFSFIFLLFTLPLIAGSGGRYYTEQPAPVSEKIAILKAKEIILKLVDSKQLHISWKDIEASSAKKKIYNDRPEWVILFNNQNITDKNKQNLYIFLRLHGEFIAINHTGL